MSHFERVSKQKVSINVLQAMRMADKAWRNVTPLAVKNCFRTCGFSSEPQEIIEEEDNNVAEEWNKHMSGSNVSFEDFVTCDDEVVTAGTLTEEEILESVDISPEEFHNSIKSEVAVHSDIKPFVEALNKKLAEKKFSLDSSSKWWQILSENQKKNMAFVEAQSNDKSVPLNYYAVFKTVQANIPKDSIIVSEGANTMDIGRGLLLNNKPRHRLDAGTFGTMGVGPGFAVAAAMWCRDYAPEKRVICVEGDSAFGFSGMEIETMFRYKLPVIIIIVNNNGIYNGFDKETMKDIQSSGDVAQCTPPTALSTEVRYEKMMEMFGVTGHLCRTVEEIQSAVKAAIAVTDRPSIINILISPQASRKPQTFNWLTESKL
ncbi:unnamed protein product [Euphydryas editha]|uniref:2-hydroxyacyl-CoA lyase n=1 Tax=Euphydryas editha TaxID=104508 RepID=A0AAU9U435_EUPED|nr:unnamed protein product [Euphydryas editha]